MLNIEKIVVHQVWESNNTESSLTKDFTNFLWESFLLVLHIYECTDLLICAT